jgi:hypothetical protein
MDNLTKAILLNWTSQIFGIVGVATGKISISALLLNIMRDTGWTWQRVYVWTVTIVITSLVAISCSLLTFLQCSPPQRLWDPRIEGTCIDPKTMAGYGIFTGCRSVNGRSKPMYLHHQLSTPSPMLVSQSSHSPSFGISVSACFNASSCASFSV